MTYSFVKTLRAVDLTGTQAAGAYAYGGVSTVNDSLYLADVRFPHSVSLTMGMGVVMTKGNALSADAALCHFKYTSVYGIFRQVNVSYYITVEAKLQYLC